MTQLVPGELLVRQQGRDIYMAVGDGFVEVTGDHVAVLTDMAVPADQIDETKAEEAKRRAEARLAEHMDDEETATVHAALANSMAQLAVKRRRKGRM
jgi:F-type H+-transporting ATPase subunit epsilon